MGPSTTTRTAERTVGVAPDDPHGAGDVGVFEGDVLGRYRIVRPIGEGAMGAVFEAVHDDIGRRVALKVLRPERARGEAARTRFFREARAAARVQHPGVVQVHDVDAEGERVYLVMELVPGETLARRLERGPMAPAELVAALSPALDGVAAAHDAHVVHRDLKPANILLRETPEGPRAVVLDFGVSRLVDEDSELTGSLAVLGTPAFMSPEQARGVRDVTAASDQFSLGAVLYACLSGRRPFDGQSPLELVFRIQRNQRPALARLCPDAPRALVAAIERAMAPDIDGRFPSVRALSDALKRSLDAPSSNRLPARLAVAATLTTLAVWGASRGGPATSPSPRAAVIASTTPAAHVAPVAPAPTAAPRVAPPPHAAPPHAPPQPAASPLPRPVRRPSPAAPSPRRVASPAAPTVPAVVAPETASAPLSQGRNRAPVLGR